MRGGNHGLNRVRHVMRTAVIVLILAVSGGLAISSLMSGATLMELNAQVDESAPSWPRPRANTTT